MTAGHIVCGFEIITGQTVEDALAEAADALRRRLWRSYSLIGIFRCRRRRAASGAVSVPPSMICLARSAIASV